MFKERTKVNYEPLKVAALDDASLYFGSCFAEHVFRDFRRYGLAAYFSPYGITYNSANLAQHLTNLMERRAPQKSDLQQNDDGLWFSYDFHGDANNTNPEIMLQEIQRDFANKASKLATAQFLIISLGTSYVYRDKNTKRIVNNCHKQPNQQFHRENLPIEDQLQLWQNCLRRLLDYNNDLQVIFTVSPIRHLRDSVTENSRSKAALIYVVHELVDRFNHCHYFPAYELLIDELRDYRFYAADLCHPSELAVSYICENFRSYLFKDTAPFSEIEKYLRQKNHKIKFPETKSSQKFIQDTAAMHRELMTKYPFLSFMED